MVWRSVAGSAVRYISTPLRDCSAVVRCGLVLQLRLRLSCCSFSPRLSCRGLSDQLGEGFKISRGDLEHCGERLRRRPMLTTLLAAFRLVERRSVETRE